MSQRKEKYARRMEREVAGLEQSVNSMKTMMDMDRQICADDAYRKERTEKEERERRRRMHSRMRRIEQSMDRLRVALLIAIVLGVLALSIVFIMVFNMGQAGADLSLEAGTASASYTDTVPTSAEYRECEADAWAGK